MTKSTLPQKLTQGFNVSRMFLCRKFVLLLKSFESVLLSSGLLKVKLINKQFPSSRYIAITDPFNYSKKMSKKKIIIMLCVTWFSSLALSHLPIHTRFYTSNNAEALVDNMCTFPVNRVYAVISSFISFWIPTFVMLFTYQKIYREARRQTKNIEKATFKTSSSPYVPLSKLDLSKSINSLNQKSDILFQCDSLLQVNEKTKKYETEVKQKTKPSTSSVNFNSKNYLSPNCFSKSSDNSSLQRSPNSHKKSFSNLLLTFQKSTGESKTSFYQQESNKKMKSEHKAAKTLGVIMGVFLGCWLPFFIWYLTDSICQELYQTPRVVITALFWVGYCNSALNPIIYACLNKNFRRAFKQQLCPKGHNKDHLNRLQSEKDSLQSEVRGRNKIEQV